MTRNPLEVLEDYTRSLGDTFHYYFGGALPVLVSSRPALLNHILKFRAADFAKSEIQTVRMTEFLGSGLLTLHGEAWRRRRRLIQQGFGSRALSVLEAKMQACLAQDLDRPEAAAEARADAAEVLSPLILRMVARSLLGAEFNAAEVRLLSEAITRLQAFMVRRIVQPWLEPWFRMSGAVARHQRLRRRGDAVIAGHIARRQARGAEEDLLQILIGAGAGAGESEEAMTEAQLLAEGLQLVVAGYETSSTTLVWALYLLAGHPETLTRLREECQVAIGDHLAGAGDIERLPLTMAVLKETLRLYPPFWMVDRVALSDSEADGVRIRVGERLVLLIRAAHRDPRYWSAPNCFRPERFLGEEQANERNGAWIPFGAGPRTCIGMRYAMVQMLMVLTAVIRRYDLVRTVADPAPEKPRFILSPAAPIINLAPRDR
jgi:cytochrome P450